LALALSNNLVPNFSSQRAFKKRRISSSFAFLPGS
jgi:hypothetical protein